MSLRPFSLFRTVLADYRVRSSTGEF